MGMLGFLWDVYQQGQIGEAQRGASRAVSDARSAATDIRSLESRVDQLSLVNMALWSLVRERFQLSDADLERRVQEIDLSDGRLDGRVNAPTRTCSSCGRKMATRHSRCIYCGGSPVG